MLDHLPPNRTHVVIIDGTLSSLEPGYETNAGLLYKLLTPGKAAQSVFYEPGIQWTGLLSGRAVLTGMGLNRMIERAYGALASRYRPGDRIFLFGFSRGAFAVRSLAGVIDLVGLVRADCATTRMVRAAYRHYRFSPMSDAAKAFRATYAHEGVAVEMVGVWDTVKALGIRLPLLWRLTEETHAFHSHELGPTIAHGFHALALNETREAYAPVLWECRDAVPGRIEQVWFRGNHADIGGQIKGRMEVRPLSNIPLVWMLDRAEMCGLHLPEDWRAKFPQDVTAPSTGNWRGWSKLFWIRKTRVVGKDPSERIHESVQSGR